MNECIASDPNICGGEAVVVGTRIPVRVVLSHLAAGETEADILHDFPTLRREHIRACLEYAAYLSSEMVLAQCGGRTG